MKLLSVSIPPVGGNGSINDLGIKAAQQRRPTNHGSPAARQRRPTALSRWVPLGLLLLGLCLANNGCKAPIGAIRATPMRSYHQTQKNAISQAQPSGATMSVLQRFDQVKAFAKAPDSALILIHQQAVEKRERGLLFALSELNYLAGERARRGAPARASRDARDYYLAAAVYAWFFLFGEAVETPTSDFDQRFRTACDLYNYGLSWALTEPRSTNAVAVLEGGVRRLPVGQINLEFSQPSFAWSLTDFMQFVIADQFLVRGLSVRNRQAGLGAPLVGVTKPTEKISISRGVPATAFLRLTGSLSDLAPGRCRGTLELHSAFDATTVPIGDRSVPLETDTTIHLAYALNQKLLWQLGKKQFLSFKETIPTDIYLTHPYRPGKVPVVFVHGTFSSPVWWAEMFNTLAADPELRKRCQFWQFTYNSGNPLAYSAVKLRESLTAKIKELDPEGKDPALQQIVVIGHSQGGLLTKLTATDTGDNLWQAVLQTNRLEALTAEQQELTQRYMSFQALPFVKRVVFISTPHRGSYLAKTFARRLARKFVTLPSRLVNLSAELGQMTEKLNFRRDFRGMPTSLDSMSPRNPLILALADLSLAPGVKGHSIIAVKGSGDYHQGKDGLVTYSSAHVDYVESEFIVRGPHSCQSLPPTIEEVRRILRKHLSLLSAQTSEPSKGPVSP